jgi:hypothetical protein
MVPEADDLLFRSRRRSRPIWARMPRRKREGRRIGSAFRRGPCIRQSEREGVAARCDLGHGEHSVRFVTGALLCATRTEALMVLRGRGWVLSQFVERTRSARPTGRRRHLHHPTGVWCLQRVDRGADAAGDHAQVTRVSRRPVRLGDEDKVAGTGSCQGAGGRHARAAAHVHRRHRCC